MFGNVLGLHTPDPVFVTADDSQGLLSQGPWPIMLKMGLLSWKDL